MRKCESVTIKTNGANSYSNQEVKPDSRRSALELLYIPLDNELSCSIAFLIERVKTDK